MLRKMDLRVLTFSFIIPGTFISMALLTDCSADPRCVIQYQRDQISQRFIKINLDERLEGQRNVEKCKEVCTGFKNTYKDLSVFTCFWDGHLVTL